MKFGFLKIDEISENEFQAEIDSMMPQRRERILRYKNKEDQKRSVAGQILAKRMLVQHFGVESPQICHTEKGKPFTDIKGLNLSISHSDKLVVCAIDENPIGIDVEKLRPFNLKLIIKVCTESEKDYILAGKTLDKVVDNDPDKELLLRFYEVWTAKEGYFKREGTGITNLKSVNVLELKREWFLIDDYFVQIVY